MGAINLMMLGGPRLLATGVTAWLALRNDAAHGNYDEYDHKQVAALIQGVRDFMVRHSA